MLLIPNRYATSCQVVDDGYYWYLLANPLSVPKDQLPAFMMATPSGLSGRGHDALGDLTAIILEYDTGEVTVDDFADRYKDLQWYLYTTSSHTPEHHRFRAMLPLAEPVDYRIALSHRPAVNTYFAGCDPLSLCNFQAAPRKTEHYTWRCNAGDYYSFDRIREMVASKPELMQRPRQQASLVRRNCFGQIIPIRDPARYADAVWRDLLDELWTIPRHRTGGQRHIPFFKVISGFCEAAANGQYLFTDAEILQVIMAHTCDDKRRKMVDQQLKARRERI